MIEGVLDAMRSDLELSARLVWQCLENHANGTRWWAIPIREIAREINLSTDSVTKAVKVLEAKKIVGCVKRRRSTTVYHMLRSYETAAPETVLPTSTETAPKPVLPTSTERGGCAAQQYSNSSTPVLPTSTELPNLCAAHQHKVNPPAREVSKNPKTNVLGGVGGGEPAGFPEFWASYPRKEPSRAEAVRSWQRAIKDGAKPEEIILGVKRFSFSDERKYQPHVTTWLNQKRWTSIDEPRGVVTQLNPQGVPKRRTEGFIP